MTTPTDSWTASISALGPITQMTPLTVAALAPHLPGYALTLKPAPDDTHDNPIVVARRAGENAIAMNFVGHRETGAVVTVRVHEPGRIANAFMIGSKFSETLLKPDRCLRNEGPFCTFISCGMADEPWLLYWITSEEIAATEGSDVPPDDVIARGTISFISWIPWRAPNEADT